MRLLFTNLTSLYWLCKKKRAIRNVKKEVKRRQIAKEELKRNQLDEEERKKKIATEQFVILEDYSAELSFSESPAKLIGATFS